MSVHIERLTLDVNFIVLKRSIFDSIQQFEIHLNELFTSRWSFFNELDHDLSLIFVRLLRTTLTLCHETKFHEIDDFSLSSLDYRKKRFCKTSIVSLQIIYFNKHWRIDLLWRVILFWVETYTLVNFEIESIKLFKACSILCSYDTCDERKSRLFKFSQLNHCVRVLIRDIFLKL